MSYENILFGVEDGIARVTINRPDKMNALNHQTLTELGHAFDAVAADDSARALIITGAGSKAFVAGADIGELLEVAGQAEKASELAAFGQGVFRKLESLGKPSIAMINGFALGGGLELALACDIIVAAEHAELGLPEPRRGLIAGGVGVHRLPRQIGLKQAMGYLLTGRHMTAQRAYELGLVNKIVAPEDLMEEAVKTIETIASMGPRAITKVKRVMHEGAERPLEAANQLEVEGFAALFNTEDQTEGMRAFIDKRSPEFKNA